MGGEKKGGGGGGGFSGKTLSERVRQLGPEGGF